jgi:hypothetical protein
MGSDEEQVLRAHAVFYDAFADRDMDAMNQIWALRAPVTCIHPGWSLLIGRNVVLESWRSILEGPNPPEVVSSREVVRLLGETALVLCVETLAEGQLMATNVLVREDGDWKIVHHQAGLISSAPGFDDDDDDDDDEPPPGLLN